MGSVVVLSYLFLGLLANARGLSHNENLSPETIQKHPYFASIEIKSQYACAATIIDDKYVMTTYSCVEGIDVKSLGVRVGTARQGYRGEYFKVVDVTRFKGNSFIGPPPQISYDVAMVKIAVSFTYDPHVMWANPNADGIEELQEGTVVSWGDPKSRGSPLVSASAYVLPSANCSQIYSGVMNISEYMYCLWPTDPNIPLCFADMGAPFYLNEQYYGIVTHTPGCSDPNWPIVITGIAKFTSFIISVLCDMQSIFGSSADVSADSFPLQDFLMARQSMMG